ncbi:unnamed protein product [Fusarium fujikuroi]|nr:unnamed protein product [Fusarium fujikuroi]
MPGLLIGGENWTKTGPTASKNSIASSRRPLSRPYQRVVRRSLPKVLSRPPARVTRDPSKVRKSKNGVSDDPAGPWIMAPNTDIATRAFVVSLKAPCCGKTSPEVSEITGLSIRTIDRIYARAIDSGFDPNVRPLILKDEYLRDKPRSGRPTKATEENKELVIGKVQRDRFG